MVIVIARHYSPSSPFIACYHQLLLWFFLPPSQDILYHIIYPVSRAAVPGQRTVPTTHRDHRSLRSNVSCKSPPLSDCFAVSLNLLTEYNLFLHNNVFN